VCRFRFQKETEKVLLLTATFKTTFQRVLRARTFNPWPFTLLIITGQSKGASFDYAQANAKYVTIRTCEGACRVSRPTVLKY